MSPANSDLNSHPELSNAGSKNQPYLWNSKDCLYGWSTMTCMVTAHVSNAGHCTPSVYIVLTVPKIWLIFGPGIKWPGDPDF